MTTPTTTVAPSTIPAPGFADPARQAQQTFRAVLNALSRPTLSFSVAGPPEAPALLGPALAAVLLTLLDEECSVWLGGRLAEDGKGGEGKDGKDGKDGKVDAWLTFHTGVRRARSAADADFVVVEAGALPALEDLAQGSEEEPHRSATVVLDVRGGTGSGHWLAHGPGIDGSAVLHAPWAGTGFHEQWTRNAARFPRGVDLLLVDSRSVTGLPRTTRLEPTTEEA